MSQIESDPGPLPESNLGAPAVVETTLEVSDASPPVESNLPDFASIVPPDFATKGWIKEVKDVPAFFKMYDDAKTALSHRPAGIPHDTAPQAEWDEFNKLRGVPETDDAYKFEIEGKEFTEQDKQFHEALRPILREAGVSQQQLAKLAPGFEKAAQEIAKAQGVAAQEKDFDFDKQADATFGGEKDRVMQLGKALLADNLSKSLQPGVEKLDNGSLIILADVLNNMAKKYISDDQLPSPNTSTAMGSEVERQAERRRLMALSAYGNKFDPEHESLVARVASLY